MQCDSTLLLMLQKPEEYPQDSYDATILSLIHETRKAIAKKANELGSIVVGNDEFVVGHLFLSKAPNTELEWRDYSRAAMSAMIEFLDWVSSIWHQSVKPTTLLINFLYDLGYARILAEDDSFRMRSHVWGDNFNFRDIEAAYLYDLRLQRIYSEALCIFGLRQTLEHKFSSLFGFVETIPIVKIPHDFWPKILHKYTSTKRMRFADGEIDIHRIMRVYSWTNDSVHGMKTDFVWTVWKAFQVCRSIFMPMTAGGIRSIADSATIVDSDFESLRQDAIEEIAKSLVCEGDSCEVVFAKPEVIVTDSSSHATNRFDAVARIQVNGLKKRKES